MYREGREGRGGQGGKEERNGGGEYSASPSIPSPLQKSKWEDLLEKQSGCKPLSTSDRLTKVKLGEGLRARPYGSATEGHVSAEGMFDLFALQSRL